ncbi:MAG: CpsB/CapC family capsule biosynthesis tyrosine phosphatase [Lachnospiraceae bacterium]
MKGLIDIHCHMLPETDDGARNMKEAVDMLRLAYMNGTRSIILTPHFHGGRYVTSKEKILEQYLKFKKIAEKASSSLHIYIGHEINYQQDIVERLRKDELFTMADSGYILIEFSPGVTFTEIKQGFQQLIFSGYVPILAHAERYGCLVKEYELAEQLVEMGAYIQINAASITNADNPRVRKFIKRMLGGRLIHLIASDAHDCQYRTPDMKEAYLYIRKKYGSQLANELLIKNPERILKNEYI